MERIVNLYIEKSRLRGGGWQTKEKTDDRVTQDWESAPGFFFYAPTSMP